jgi:hypothetical protein
VPVATPRLARKTAEREQRAARRRDRHEARHVLWEESRKQRLRKCGRSPVGDGSGAPARIGIKVTRGGAEGPVAGFSGISTCGSVWACPVCSAKILTVRQDELERGLSTWRAAGGTVALITLTMRHHRSQSLRHLWEGLSAAWSGVTSGRDWAREQAAYGSPTTRTVTSGARKGQEVTEDRIGWVRVVEATHGDNGWHVHVHAALLLPGTITPEQVDDLGCGMFQRWRDRLIKRGFRAPLALRDKETGERQGGLTIKLWQGESGVLSDYFTKNDYASAEPTKGLAAEVVRGDHKVAKGDNRTPFQILRDITRLGLADDLDLWHEWEEASSGKRQMTWSVGLRAQLLTEPEQTDEEIAEDEGGGDLEVVLPSETWIAIVRTRTACELLEAAEAGRLVAQKWLDAKGWAWENPPPDGRGVLPGQRR